MLRLFMRTVLWISAAFASAVLLFGAPFIWPDPLFAFSVSDGKITVKSDRPIPTAGGKRLLDDCEMLLNRSPLKANGRQYEIYVTNDRWRQRLFFLADPNAHGLTYQGIRKVFLSGADFETGAAMGVGRLLRLCGHREPAGIRAVPRRSRRQTCRRSHDDKVWQLSAIPPPRHVLHGENGVVCGSAIPIETDRR
jgi:hypothetical protein